MTSSRPLIGLTTYTSKNEYGNPVVALATHYIRAVLEAGGLPVLIPNRLREAEWREFYARLDGVVFTGGGDIQPEMFGGEPHPNVDGVDPERDALELPLVRAAAQDGKPFLGICRGLQVVNVALGGTLFTDVADQLPGALRHDWHEGFPRTHLAHSVQVAENSRLSQVFGESVTLVNSLHHQGIRDLAPVLQPTAFAPDGLVEAVELPGHPFGLAVQWHPEWLMEHESARRLFQTFVEVCRTRMNG
ncbi:MAG: gamma-glutamyl-gamma-aminobutyrate hydrolase family protein [Anaerolineales bacterium]|nr:gamma-glutamyl-gamma-aminobutyrate hydrolase family protein [Anaerolineales bacterium]MCX7755655.1 gamma-glutamyl-gamma-aminobutyrate hydrolase family protein [Anaerolineales bacterium]MDW8278959.1 gamma-glutamyl-gamma-aminobutyrate hydrolase family protein [Anaerolineales bacterium]